jgi:hypothetical protein
MSFFCLLWPPLFYFFWISLGPEKNFGAGGVWAILLGSVVALVQFFFGPIIKAGGFGWSRWFSALVDIVTLPALLPFLVYALFSALRIFSGSVDMTNFALLWLIPGAVFRSVSWSAQNDPTLLILVPLLWTAIALGIPFFFNMLREYYGLVLILSGIGILALPFAAATAYWAFFSHQLLPGSILLGLTLIPMGVVVGLSFHRVVRANPCEPRRKD